MRIISMKLEEEGRFRSSQMFSKTADSCRLVRLYLESFINPGVSSEERLSCMAYVLQFLRSLYNPWSMPPGKSAMNLCLMFYCSAHILKDFSTLVTGHILQG